MAESFNLSFGIIGEGGRPSKIKKPFFEISLNDALNRVQNLPISDKEKKDLSNILKKAPNGALGQVLSNYKNYLKKT